MTPKKGLLTHNEQSQLPSRRCESLCEAWPALVSMPVVLSVALANCLWKPWKDGGFCRSGWKALNDGAPSDEAASPDRCAAAYVQRQGRRTASCTRSRGQDCSVRRCRPGGGRGTWSRLGACCQATHAGLCQYTDYRRRLSPVGLPQSWRCEAKKLLTRPLILNESETEFLRSMALRRDEPTPKQAGWLRMLRARASFGAEL